VRDAAPRTDAELEARLSEPSPAVAAALAAAPGDVVVLGAGGKMGPTLARLVRRALDGEAGPVPDGRSRRVLAVSRWRDEGAERAPSARSARRGWRPCAPTSRGAPTSSGCPTRRT
jgi:hypothetical protein